MYCSWCKKKYKHRDDIIDRMEWNAKDDAWTIWCGDTIHRTCDNKRFEYELYMMDLEHIRKMKQTKVTDYFTEK